MTTDLDNLHLDADGENNKNLSAEETSKTDSEPQKPEEQKDEEIQEVESQVEGTEEIQSEQAEESSETTEVSKETRDETEEPVTESEVSEGSVVEEPAETPENKESEEVEGVGLETSEDEEEEDGIPFKDYDELPLAVLIGEAKELLRNHPARLLKNHFYQIREAVFQKLKDEETAAKEAFISAGGEEIAFQYNNPARKDFNSVYSDYRNQLDAFFKEQEKAQQDNLKERLEIIEELKALYQDPNDDNTNIFSKFRKLKTRWHNAGMVPKTQAGNVFKTYFHHLDNFYLYLDLNKELREMDYAHNLQVRESIIKRAEELVQEDNVQKALNELQYLHRLWKEEAVPVAEELREPTWQKFKELTVKIHDRKSELGEKIKEEQEENLNKKKEILNEIRSLYEGSENKSHGEWQTGIKKLNKLREGFIAIGRVPKEFNQKLWDEFKNETREFNHRKNEFYKNLKLEQQKNLAKKEELLQIAKEHENSTDWDSSVQIIKRIQSDWKKVGHVPRKESDKIWKEFKEACNKFFDNYKARGSRINHEFTENLAKKEELLKELNAFKIGDNTEADLEKINEFNVRWSGIGKVPAARMDINHEFSKKISELVKSLGLSDDEVQDFKMSALVDRIKSGQDEQMLGDEIRKTKKIIEDLEKEINQLENNVAFFTDENSPLLKNVHKQIEEKRARLSDSELKLRKLHRIDFDEDEATDENTADESADSAEN